MYTVGRGLYQWIFDESDVIQRVSAARARWRELLTEQASTGSRSLTMNIRNADGVSNHYC